MDIGTISRSILEALHLLLQSVHNTLLWVNFRTTQLIHLEGKLIFWKFQNFKPLFWWPRAPPLFHFSFIYFCFRYGVWIFKDYFPRRGGGCGSRISAPAKFHTLLAYNNLKGFELTNGGAIQTINFTVIDNSEAGLEFTKVAGPWGYDGPLVKDCLVVGHSAISENPSACTMGGLVAPMSSRLTVSNTTFVNFDAGSCAVLRACSFCREREGGYTTRFEKLQFINSPNKVGFKWQHEAVLLDLDGTLTGKWTNIMRYEMCYSSAFLCRI